jgi:hypothetical protein
MSLQTMVLVAVAIVAIAALVGCAAKFRRNLIADAIAKTVEILRDAYAERGREGVLREIKEGGWITNFHDAQDKEHRVYFRSNQFPEFVFYILDLSPDFDPIFCVRGEGAFRGFEASAGLDRGSPKGCAQAHEAFGNDPTGRAKALAATFLRRHGWTPNESLMGWRKGVYVGK